MDLNKNIDLNSRENPKVKSYTKISNLKYFLKSYSINRILNTSIRLFIQSFSHSVVPINDLFVNRLLNKNLLYLKKIYQLIYHCRELISSDLQLMT